MGMFSDDRAVQSEYEAFIRSKPPVDTPAPPGCKIVEFPDGFEAIVSLRSAYVMGAVPMAIFWNGIIFVFVNAMPCCIPFLSLHIAAGIILVWYAFLYIAGTTIFRFDAREQTVRISTGLGVLRLTRTRKVIDIRGVCRDTNIWLLKGKREPPVRCLRIDAAKPIRFAGMMNHEKREWLYAVTVAALGAVEDPRPSPNREWWQDWV